MWTYRFIYLLNGLPDIPSLVTKRGSYTNSEGDLIDFGRLIIDPSYFRYKEPWETRLTPVH